MNPTRTYVLPQDLEDDARAGRVGSVLLDFDLSSPQPVEPGQRFRALAHCPAHVDNDPSLVVTVLDDGKILHHCQADDGCTQEKVRAAMGQEWPRWYPQGRRSQRKRRPPPLLHQLAIQTQHRALLRRGEEMTALLSSGITLDAITVLRVGFETMDAKARPWDLNTLDRLVFYLQDDDYVGRLLYSLPKGNPRRKLVQGRHGLTMRRGGPAAGPIVVVEGSVSALAGFSMRCECIGVPGIRWSFSVTIESSSSEPRSSS